MVRERSELPNDTATPATPPGFCFGGPEVVAGGPKSLVWSNKYV